MKEITAKIHKLLIARGKTLSIAESCTGGLLSSLLTKLPGSSQYFIFGAITYSDQAKVSILKIPSSLIRRKGAVSDKVAILMAKKIRALAKTDFGIGITGIAGPTGATPHKPVGTVFIAISSKNKILCKKLKFRGNRQNIIKKSALKALRLLQALL
jgi:PncC family amidohydrolase